MSTRTKTINGKEVIGYFVESCSINASFTHRKEIVNDLLQEYESFFIYRGSLDLFYYGYNNN